MGSTEGDADAQYNRGVAYHTGQGVVQDLAEAVKWYRRAAAQGLAAAQNNLGTAYDTGLGVVQDHAEAVKWYRLAAAQGDTSARLNLGACYLNGQGVAQNSVLAHMWITIAEAAATGFTKTIAATRRDQVAAKMTPAKIAEAQALAKKCMESKFKNCGG
jgi:hypothetical protein